MQPLLNIVLWFFFWPLKLPLWLWQQETIGKVFATLWIACILVLGLNLLPRQGQVVGHAPATAELGSSLQSILLTRLRRATPLAVQTDEPAETLLPSQKVLLDVTVVNPSPTPLLSSSATALSSVTSTPAVTIDSSVVTTTLVLLPTSTPLPTPTATAAQSSQPTDTEQPSKRPTTIPTVTPFYTPTPDSASQLVATPTVLDPTSINIANEPQLTATSSALVSNPGGFTCAGGCSEAPDPSCAIKGNVNAKGDKIYHMPGGKNYDLTRIKPVEGDRWFCTEQEAQDAGFRAAKSY